jgi:DNA repair exonuclease SbcCD nuclease subunit
MVKVLAVGDVHIKLDNLLEIQKLTEEILSIIKHHQPDYLVLLGDILHTHERIHTNCLNQAADLFRKCSALLPTYVLVGNHDYISNSQFLTTEHWMNPFKEWPGLSIVDRVTRVGEAVLCPYVPDGRFVEALDTLEDWQSASLIFAHQTLDGVKMGPVAVEGVEKWREDYPMLCCGHIHDRQRPQQNLYYTGTPIPHAFGEGNEKSVALFTDGELKEIPLDVCKKKIYYLTTEEAYQFSYLPKPELLHRIRLTIRGSPEENKAFRKSGKYRELLSQNVKMVFDQPEKEEEQKLQVKRVEELLYEMVKSDIHLKHHYHTYFSGLTSVEFEE